MRRRISLRRAAAILLWWIVPAVAVACVGTYFGLAAARHVYPPLVPVEGKSMRPFLHAGDLVFLKQADVSKLRKGDVIAFRTTSEARKQYGVPGRYVHRIVEVQKGARGFQFKTKGDNVGGPDPFWTTQRDVIGEYAGKASGLGYPILFFRSRQGMILAGALGLILALYLALGFFDRRSEERERTAVELSTMVDEVRTLAGALGGARPQPLDVAALEQDVARASVRADDDVRETLRELVGAIGEYGRHLQSHTAVMQNLAATTGELQLAAVALRSGLSGAAPTRAEGATMDPADLAKRSFRPALRGYDREEVDASLAQAVAALERGERERRELAARLEAAERELAAAREREAQAADTLAAQQRAVDELRAQAEREARLIVDEARLRARELTADAETRRDVLEAETRSVRALLHGALEALDEKLPRRAEES